jgi:hypothetical protein
VGVVADVDAGEGPAVVAARREVVGCTHDNGIITSVRRSSLRELLTNIKKRRSKNLPFTCERIPMTRTAWRTRMATSLVFFIVASKLFE